MKKLGLILLITAAVTGCSTAPITMNGHTVNHKGIFAGFNNMLDKASLDIYNEISNKPLRDAFLMVEPDVNGGVSVIPVKPLLAAGFIKDKIKSEDGLFGFELRKWYDSDGNVVRNHIRNNDYRSDADLAAKYFVDQARSQGHTVRQYNSRIADRVNDRLVTLGAQPEKNIENIWAKDPVFVEYDANNRVVAFMTRKWQVTQMFAYQASMYTNIYFGQTATQWFEKEFDNADLSQSLMRKYD